MANFSSVHYPSATTKTPFLLPASTANARAADAHLSMRRRRGVCPIRSKLSEALRASVRHTGFPYSVDVTEAGCERLRHPSSTRVAQGTNVASARIALALPPSARAATDLADVERQGTMPALPSPRPSLNLLGGRQQFNHRRGVMTPQLEAASGGEVYPVATALNLVAID